MRELRFFDTGDKEIDKLLSSLDHSAAPMQVFDTADQLQNWLYGVIERTKQLPEQLHHLINPYSFMIGDEHYCPDEPARVLRISTELNNKLRGGLDKMFEEYGVREKKARR